MQTCPTRPALQISKQMPKSRCQQNCGLWKLPLQAGWHLSCEHRLQLAGGEVELRKRPGLWCHCAAESLMQRAPLGAGMRVSGKAMEVLEAGLRHVGRNGSAKPQFCKPCSSQRRVARRAKATYRTKSVCGHWHTGGKQNKAMISKATRSLKGKAQRTAHFLNYRLGPTLPSECLRRLSLTKLRGPLARQPR